MNKLIITIFYIFGLLGTHEKQDDNILKLKVLRIVELNDCYILSTIKKNSVDTLYLISIKDSLEPSIKYKKISVGKKFFFVIKDRNLSLSIPDENFRLRVKNTVVWRGDEDFKKYPFFIENSKGLYVENVRRWKCARLVGGKK